MKKLIFLLSISLLTLTGSLKAQTQDSISKQAGVELTEYYKQHTTGVVVSTIGTVMLTLGSTVIANSSVDGVNYAGGVFLSLIGGAMTIIGGIDVLLAPNHIKKAGLIMSGRRK